jgi:hypothetical protein
MFALTNLTKLPNASWLQLQPDALRSQYATTNISLLPAPQSRTEHILLYDLCGTDQQHPIVTIPLRYSEPTTT